MFGRKHRQRSSTVHYDCRRHYHVAEDGTLHSEIPLLSGSAAELEMRAILAWILRHVAEQLATPTQADGKSQDEIIDVTFESDLQSGST